MLAPAGPHGAAWAALPSAEDASMGEDMAALGARNAARLQHLYAEYTKGDRQVVFDALAEDVVWRSNGGDGLAWSGERRARAGVEAYFAALDSCARVVGYEVERIIASGEWVVGLSTVHVEAVGTGERRSYAKADVFRMRDGRIAEFREYYDTGAALAQFCAAA
jgi:ketosteroid isomerase-like protein